MIRAAKVSGCGLYRYELMRSWLGPHDSDTSPSALWIMLNPSTADGEQDDPTIRRCIDYSNRWGCKRLSVVNLFAFRATSPSDLLAAIERGDDAIGPKTDAYLRGAIDDHKGRADLIIAAWGALGSHRLIKPRRDAVLRMLPVADTMCLTTCTTGDPRHPLYSRAELVPEQYPFPRSAWEI